MGDLTLRGLTTRHQIKQWCPLAVRIDCCLYYSGVRARLNRTCWTISELNPVCHDSTAALTVACSFRVQSAILSALMRSPYSRVTTTAATAAVAARTKTRTGRRPCQQRRLEGHRNRQLRIYAATTSDDCSEVCLVAPRAGFALVPCGHARFCEACAMRMSVSELVNLVCPRRNN